MQSLHFMENSGKIFDLTKPLLNDLHIMIEFSVTLLLKIANLIVNIWIFK